MSSPNLNVLTLCGSVLTYISGFLFAVEDHTHSPGGTSSYILQVSVQDCLQRGTMESACGEVAFLCSLVQARIWTLCLGSTLVFGPILGKTWRLYRVFTQRVPDKRVVSLHVFAAETCASAKTCINLTGTFVFYFKVLFFIILTLKANNITIINGKQKCVEIGLILTHSKMKHIVF